MNIRSISVSLIVFLLMTFPLSSLADAKLCGEIEAIGGVVVNKNITLQQGVPFSKQVKDKNTKYIIKRDFKLDRDVTIPDNCILEFEGGCLSGGKINLNNCKITSTEECFGEDITLTGLFSYDIKVSWFKKPEDAFNKTHEITNPTYGGGGVMIVAIHVDRDIKITETLNIRNRTIVYGNNRNATRIIMDTHDKPVFSFPTTSDEIAISDLNILGGKNVIAHEGDRFVKVTMSNLYCFGQSEYTIDVKTEMFVGVTVENVKFHYCGGGIRVTSTGFIYGSSFKNVDLTEGRKYGLLHLKQSGEAGINHLTFERITYDTGVIEDEAALYVEGSYISNFKVYDGWLENIKYKNHTLACPVLIKATKEGKIVKPNSSIMDASNIQIEFLTIANNNVSDRIMSFYGDFRNVELRDILVDGNAYSLAKKEIFFNDNARDITLYNSPKCRIVGEKVIYGDLNRTINRINGYVKNNTINKTDIADYLTVIIDSETDDIRRNYIKIQSYNGSTFVPLGAIIYGSKLYDEKGKESYRGGHYVKEAKYMLIKLDELAYLSCRDNATWYVNIDDFRGTSALRSFSSTNPKTTGNIESLGACINIQTIDCYKTSINGDWMDFVNAQRLNGRDTCGGIDISFAAANKNILFNGRYIDSTDKCRLSWNHTKVTMTTSKGEVSYSLPEFNNYVIF